MSDGWLVVLRIYVAKAIFQPCRHLKQEITNLLNSSGETGSPVWNNTLFNSSPLSHSDSMTTSKNWKKKVAHSKLWIKFFKVLTLCQLRNQLMRVTRFFFYFYTYAICIKLKAWLHHTNDYCITYHQHWFNWGNYMFTFTIRRAYRLFIINWHSNSLGLLQTKYKYTSKMLLSSADITNLAERRVFAHFHPKVASYTPLCTTF